MSWWIVIASGPSLRRADCDKLRGLHPTVAVNNAVFYAPWADVLYAGDAAWWKVYAPAVEWYKGERVARHRDSNTNRVFGGCKLFNVAGSNSGQQAIQYAACNDGRNIALLGFDHQHTNGKAHFHKDHVRYTAVRGECVTLGNAEDPANWTRTMEGIAAILRGHGINVVNLSRETALTCFPRMTVEEFLAL